MALTQWQSGALRRPRRASGILAWLAGLAALSATPALAQQPDPAEAYGIYRPADKGAGDSVTAGVAPTDGVPADSAPVDPDTSGAGADAAAGDTVSGDSTTDSLRLTRLEEAADDTSLTARMDVWRGGGLRREEFPNLGESAALTGRYTVFLDLLRRTGWSGALADTAKVTLLAPTDSAFAALPPELLDTLRSDSAARARWAGGVLLEGDHPVSALLEAGMAETIGGTAIRVTRAPDGAVRVGDARLVQPDVAARNGMLHGTDRVALPDTARAEATSAVP